MIYKKLIIIDYNRYDTLYLRESRLWRKPTIGKLKPVGLLSRKPNNMNTATTTWTLDEDNRPKKECAVLIWVN